MSIGFSSSVSTSRTEDGRDTSDKEIRCIEWTTTVPGDCNGIGIDEGLGSFIQINEAAVVNDYCGNEKRCNYNGIS